MPAPIHNDPNNTDFGLDILHPADAAIAALAYQLWEERRRLVGSPEEDRFVSERELASHSEFEALD